MIIIEIHYCHHSYHNHYSNIQLYHYTFINIKKTRMKAEKRRKDLKQARKIGEKNNNSIQ